MADPLEFNDLFWDALPEGDIDYSEGPTSFSPTPVGTATLSIIGQGTIAAKSKATQNLDFVVSTGDGYPKLSLKITQTACTFAKEDGSQKTIYSSEHVRPETSPYLPETATADGTVYWLSIDRSNLILRYGKYYSCKALTIMQVSLTMQTGAWLEKLTAVDVTDGLAASYHHRSISWDTDRLANIYPTFAD
jgi:hypothetical protein